MVGDAVPADASWLGWSLGGLVALAAAGRGEKRIRNLVLLASTPRFVNSADWQPAVGVAVFDQFAQQLENDIDRTLGRFLALQVRNADRSGETLRGLRSAWSSRPAPAMQALRTGLHFLRETDLRDTLSRLNMPVYWLLGERDTLVPANVANAFTGIHTALVPGAGHAPFLSHAEHCSGQLQRWLLDNSREQHAAG
jgi:pimeloyl-[acyl-carrier protein] methyl ester esterase